MKTIFPALLAGALLSNAAIAAQPAAADVRWTCGGIGSDERRMLEELRRDAKLEMQFVTARRGGYVAGARVTIHRGGDTLASFEADGPLCLVDLPAGRYRIEARIGEATATSAVTIPASGPTARAVFRFPEEKPDGIEASEEEKRQARER